MVLIAKLLTAFFKIISKKANTLEVFRSWIQERAPRECFVYISNIRLGDGHDDSEEDCLCDVTYLALYGMSRRPRLLREKGVIFSNSSVLYRTYTSVGLASRRELFEGTILRRSIQDLFATNEPMLLDVYARTPEVEHPHNWERLLSVAYTGPPLSSRSPKRRTVSVPANRAVRTGEQ